MDHLKFDVDNIVFIVGVYVYFEDIKLNVFAENLPQHNAFWTGIGCCYGWEGEGI